jgi:Domain of unknown function (DUF1707)
MSTSPGPPVRLASEDVIINAPMSYAGSAQRIMRIRRRVPERWQLAAITLLAILLIVMVWILITGWYLLWGLWLVPYRLLRRGARKRRAEALRHRELLGTIQGSAAASAAAIVTAGVSSQTRSPSPVHSPDDLVADVDREGAVAGLRQHLLAGRLTAEEFEERVASAQRARTWADLGTVAMNLPPDRASAGSEVRWTAS